MAEQNGQDTESAKVGWMMVAILIACLAMALLALCHTGWKPFEWFRLCERRALHIYITVLSWAFAAGAFYLGLHRLSDMRLTARLYAGMFLLAMFLCAYERHRPDRWLIFNLAAARDFAAPAVLLLVLGILTRVLIDLVRDLRRERN